MGFLRGVKAPSGDVGSFYNYHMIIHIYILPQKKMIRVAIIGSAGRQEDAKKMSPEIFSAIAVEVEKIIKIKFGLLPENVVIVSGASSFVDDIGPHLFSQGKYAGLHLYLPSRWDDEKKCFNGKSHPDGYTIYEYHRKYSKIVLGDENLSLSRLSRLKKHKGAMFHDEPIGFFPRNTLVATQCDYMIAFTFGKGATPKPGGTKFTWDKCLLPSDKKIHVSISSIF
jgi:hypothetical protein